MRARAPQQTTLTVRTGASGSLFPTAGNPVPDAWEPYSQPVGNRLYAVWNCPHEGFHHEKAAMNPHKKHFLTSWKPLESSLQSHAEQEKKQKPVK